MATLPNSGRPAGGGALNFGVAILAAGALGFLAFAMPDDIFSNLVAQSGLPGFVEAAQPPLGMKARGAAIAAAFILAFLAVLLLLRGIDRLTARPSGAKAKVRTTPFEPDMDAPKVRRADAHPDAPVRPPLLAGRDLADFEDEDELDYPPDDMFADLPAQPLPGFMAGDRAPADEAEMAEAPIAEPEAGEELEPWVLETPFEEEIDQEPEPLVLETPVEERSVEALVSRLPASEEKAEQSDNAIASLMQRLECGLAQREIHAEEAEEFAQAEVAPETPSWLAPQPPVAESEEAAFEEEAKAAPLSFPSLHASAPDEVGSDRWAEEPAAEDEFPAEEEALDDEASAGAQEPAAPSWPEHRPVAVAPPPQPQVDEFGELRCTPRRTEKKMVQLPADPLPVEEPAPAASAPPLSAPAAEEDYPPIPETQVGHRLRNALGEMRRSAGG